MNSIVLCFHQTVQSATISVIFLQFQQLVLSLWLVSLLVSSLPFSFTVLIFLFLVSLNLLVFHYFVVPTQFFPSFLQSLFHLGDSSFTRSSAVLRVSAAPSTLQQLAC